MHFKTPLRLLRRWFLLYREVFLDGRRFLTAVPFYGVEKGNEDAYLEGAIIRQYHVVEKGLAMPEFRPGFGVSTVRALIKDLEKWKQLGLELNEQFSAGQAVLRAYRDYHARIGFDLEGLFDGVDLEGGCHSGAGGAKEFRPLTADFREAFEHVCRSRASVRTFEPEKIPNREQILEAIALASRAPSVCNRQTARAHVYTGPVIQELLKFQNGNRGFGHRVPLLFVVTSDLRLFTGVDERYQAWIDGGMFAMLLLLALHAQGLGAVALNWSVKNRSDVALRKAGDIPSHERIIMLIGCGYPEEGALVPVSQRRPAEKMVRFHGENS
jgi:nitroreductase